MEKNTSFFWLENKMNDNSKIWAVVLAAGESARMKSPKLILPYRGKTIIGNVISNILDSGIINIMVVTGAWKEEILDAIKGLPVEHCFNDKYRNGMLSSVICGLDSLPSATVAAMIFQGDQPEITRDVINSVIRAASESEKGIVIPVINGKRGHPLFIKRKYFGEVSLLDHDIGLRELQSRFSHDIEDVETGNVMILNDIDTREDYLKSISKNY